MEKVYTVKEVASLLKVHYNTVFNMLHKGDIKATKIGKQWRIKESEIIRVQNGGK